MTIRNKVVGFLLGKQVTVQEMMTHPEIAQDVRFMPAERAQDIGYAGSSSWSNGSISLHNYEPMIKELKACSNHGDWKCEYCHGINPSDKYTCIHCSAPKKKE
jgi:hypothetical protein